MVTNIYVIVGANYGDESKGLVSAHKAYEHTSIRERVLTILYNGGAQRGHTVHTDTGINFRHVFHHLGAGTLFGSDTYCASDFIVNPSVFVHEVKRLDCTFPKYLRYRVIVNPDCRVTTPFDVMANRQDTANCNHGTCGLGIFQTRNRYENSEHTSLNIRYGEMFHDMSSKDIFYWAVDVAKYYERNGKLTLSNEEIIDIATDFTRDCSEMFNKTECAELVDLVFKYKAFIFEGAQGLALSEDNTEDFPHLTPSLTGVDIPLKEIQALDIPEKDRPVVEFCFVTRPYFTRHGNGPFPTEDSDMQEEYNLFDKTNQFNLYQKFFRYGHFDVEAFSNRVKKEISKVKQVISDDVYFDVIVTHTNTMPQEEVDEVVTSIQNSLDEVSIAISSNKYSKSDILYKVKYYGG